MQFEPLGDQAVLANCDDENEAARLAAYVRQAVPSWCLDVVQAYVSVAIFYDVIQVDYAAACAWVQALPGSVSRAVEPGRLHVIPCCYDLGLDFERIAAHSRLSRDAIIHLHSGRIYTVYAIGFCPGFPYLGYLPAELANVPRLDSPRLKLEAGSVGLTGRQTGIYTEARPGGWNIVGRTPLTLVEVRHEYFPLRTGDRVRFEPIGKVEFLELKGKRLEVADLRA